VAARDKETGQQQSIQVTASGGLTESELKTILEDQADMMLEARTGEELGKRKAELSALAKEVQELIPQLQKATSGSEFGQDAVAKANKALEVAKRTVDAANLGKVNESIDTLTKTITLFKGVLQRIS